MRARSEYVIKQTDRSRWWTTQRRVDCIVRSDVLWSWPLFVVMDGGGASALDN